MNKPFTFITFLFAITIFLAGCKAAPLQNIPDTQFSAKSNIGLNQIKQAIFRACNTAGWRVNSNSANTVIASYSYKKNNYSATVSINFDYDSYSINYLNSRNLKYTKPKNSGQQSSDMWDDSQATLSEYNPFNKTATQSNTHKPTTIHKVYNQWVNALDNEISTELNILGNNVISAATHNIQPTRKALPAKRTFSCNDQPTSSVSGLATITKNSVNLRNGASTNCAKTGSVSMHDTFTLLGQKNNWYYIALDHNQNAWIYAPLVKKIHSGGETKYPKKTSLPQHTTSTAKLLPPTRNISIAVIHFKTLNKEAQEISLGDLVSETFTSSLVNSPGFKIIEREQLDKVVKEMEMNQTGFIETTDAVEIGKMLHADAIITGSVALLNKQIQLNARIIEIESAYVISAETKTSSYTLQNISNMVNEIVVKLSNKLRSSVQN